MLSTEDKYIILLTRVALGLARPEDTVIPADVDWKAVTDLAKKHGVAAIVFDGLGMMPANTISDLKQLKRLISSAVKSEQKNNLKLMVISELAEEWAKSGIRTLLLKGFAYGRYYPTPLHRTCSDVDVMLLAQDGSKVVKGSLGDEIARRMGAEVDDSQRKHSHIYYNGVTIENHHYCCGQLGDKDIMALNDFLVGVLAGKPSRRISGTALECPDLMFDALFCLYHAIFHFIISEGLQLRQLIDWVLIRRQIDSQNRRHELESLCSKYDLAKFYNAIDAVASFVAGDIEYSELNKNQALLLTEILTVDGKESAILRSKITFISHIGMLLSIWSNRWKYSLYTNISVYKMFWIYFKGYLYRLRRSEKVKE